MFTGIIEEIGKVERIQKDTCNCKLSIKASKILEDIHLGDSIAVNGICLTVTCFTRQSFTVDVMNETWNRTALSLLRHGSLVNLERAMPMNGRLGGHIVTGHIDGTGRISSVRRDKNAVWYQINTQREILNLIVEKGSIAIDGISLTVAKVSKVDFSVSLIGDKVDENKALSNGAVAYYTIYFATDKTLTISPGKYFIIEDTFYEFNNYDELWDEFIAFNSVK